MLTLFGALIAAELASAYPQAGGVYVFLREAFSPGVGFLWGWAMFWTMHTGIIAVDRDGVRAIRRRSSFRSGDVGLRVLAVARDRRPHGGELRRRATGEPRPDDAHDPQGRRRRRDHRHRVRPRATAPSRGAVSRRRRAAGRQHDLAAFALALVAGLFAFGGWHMVTYAAEETVEPERTIPRALCRWAC